MSLFSLKYVFYTCVMFGRPWSRFSADRAL